MVWYACRPRSPIPPFLLALVVLCSLHLIHSSHHHHSDEDDANPLAVDDAGLDQPADPHSPDELPTPDGQPVKASRKKKEKKSKKGKSKSPEVLMEEQTSSTSTTATPTTTPEPTTTPDVTTAALLVPMKSSFMAEMDNKLEKMGLKTHTIPLPLQHIHHPKLTNTTDDDDGGQSTPLPPFPGKDTEFYKCCVERGVDAEFVAFNMCSYSMLADGDAHVFTSVVNQAAGGNASATQATVDYMQCFGQALNVTECCEKEGIGDPHCLPLCDLSSNSTTPTTNYEDVSRWARAFKHKCSADNRLSLLKCVRAEAYPMADSSSATTYSVVTVGLSVLMVLLAAAM